MVEALTGTIMKGEGTYWDDNERVKALTETMMKR